MILEKDQELIRRALKQFSTTQLKNGMRAFNHPPRGTFGPLSNDKEGCFIHEMHDDFGLPQEWVVVAKAYEGMSPSITGFNGAWGDSTLNMEFNQFLREECIRELAERGETVEQKREEVEHYAR